MLSIDNSQILDYNQGHRPGWGITGKASFAYDGTANTISVTDESTVYDSAQTFKILHVNIYDRFGNSRYNKITSLHGTVVTSLGAITAPLANIAITAGGTGYTSAPAISITGGGGTGAAAIAFIAGGIVTGIAITNYGSGYTSAPTIAFTGGAGSGATGTATVQAGVNLPAMNASRGFAVTITAVTNLGHAKDGSAYKIANTFNGGEFNVVH